MRPIDTYLVRIEFLDKHKVRTSTVTTNIEGPTFFLARAAAARRYNVDPADIKPAIRFTMGASPHKETSR